MKQDIDELEYLIKDTDRTYWYLRIKHDFENAEIVNQYLEHLKIELNSQKIMKIEKDRESFLVNRKNKEFELFPKFLFSGFIFLILILWLFLISI